MGSMIASDRRQAQLRSTKQRCTGSVIGFAPPTITQLIYDFECVILLHDDMSIKVTLYENSRAVCYGHLQQLAHVILTLGSIFYIPTLPVKN